MEYNITSYGFTSHVVRLAGRLDAHSVPDLKPTLKRMTRSGHRYFVVDLREVSFIDSTGLSLLTSLMRAARNASGDVMLVAHADSPVHHILTLVNFNLVFGIYPTPKKALSQFKL